MPDKKNTLRGVLIGDTFKVMEVADTLDTWYKLLDCDCIDIVSTTVGDVDVDIVCDDEALLKGNPIFRATNRHREPALFGKLFVCGRADAEGDLTSLTTEQCDEILHNAALTIVNNDEARLALVVTYGD